MQSTRKFIDTMKTEHVHVHLAITKHNYEPVPKAKVTNVNACTSNIVADSDNANKQKIDYLHTISPIILRTKILLLLLYCWGNWDKSPLFHYCTLHPFFVFPTHTTFCQPHLESTCNHHKYRTSVCRLFGLLEELFLVIPGLTLLICFSRWKASKS